MINAHYPETATGRVVPVKFSNQTSLLQRQRKYRSSN